MNIRCQLFIIVAFIYFSYGVSANDFVRFPNDNCACDVLQVIGPDSLFGKQNFTKQNGTLNGKPYYFSTQRNMISWNNEGENWSYDKYNKAIKELEFIQKFDKGVFTFDQHCKNNTWKVTWNQKKTDIHSQCLTDTSMCSATKKLTRIIDSNEVKLQSKNPCQFPFIYDNVEYNSCTKDNRDSFWCATTVDANNKKTSWGYCNDLCPLEEAGKSWHIVVGILVGIVLIGLVIGYIFIKKKKKVALRNTQATEEYTLEPTMSGNQARINSSMILNDQAADLSYSGKHEIEESKFEIGKKIGGGSFGSVYEGTLPGQNTKVAVKSVKDSHDRSQVYALMCEIKVLDKLDKHLNLVNMVGACTSQISNGKLWLLLEYCPCGDMKNFLNKNRDVFMEGHHKRLNMRLFIEWGYGISKGKKEQSGGTPD